MFVYNVLFSTGTITSYLQSSQAHVQETWPATEEKRFLADTKQHSDKWINGLQVKQSKKKNIMYHHALQFAWSLYFSGNREIFHMVCNETS